MSSYATAIGVDIGGTGTKGAIIDPEGRILERVSKPTDPTSGTKCIIDVVDQLLAVASTKNLDVKAIGVGAAGFIDSDTGSVTFSPNLVYDDPQVADAVKLRTDLPVVVDNDANAGAWGERTFGVAKGLDHVVMITLGTGIGGGIISDGRLIRGSTGAGAELGHMIVEVNGPPCPCGLRGCFEQLASGTAIARMAREAVEEDPTSLILELAGSHDAITAVHVSRAASEYDEAACNVLRRAGRALGIGMSNVVNLFDPQTIVLAGGVLASGEPYLGPARDELARMTAAQRRRPQRIDTTALRNDMGILGAAALALDLVGEHP